MLKKDITFTDLNGQEVTETHYFHMSKADLIELNLSKQGGFEGWIQRVVAAEDGKSLVRELKDIILMAYGKKSEDGSRFIKSAELRAEFANSEAFSELFTEVATDATAASEFVNGIMPAGLIAETRQQMSVFDKDDPQPEETAVDTPPRIEADIPEDVDRNIIADGLADKPLDVITRVELQTMSPADIQARIASGAVIQD